MDLQEQFHNEMLGIYDACKEFGYRPAFLRNIVRDRGGVEAARRLIGNGDTPPTQGFIRLFEEQRLDLSVEALVIREPWSALFTEDVLAVARRRLEDVGYDFGEITTAKERVSQGKANLATISVATTLGTTITHEMDINEVIDHPDPNVQKVQDWIFAALAGDVQILCLDNPDVVYRADVLAYVQIDPVEG